jgi:molybdopterin-guanine dinucleotide biosynthesis protein A
MGGPVTGAQGVTRAGFVLVGGRSSRMGRDMTPSGSHGIESLCARYHRRRGTHAASAVARNELKMHNFDSSLQAVALSVPDRSLQVNTNTPEDWAKR